MKRQAASIVETLIAAAPATLDLADESQLEEVTSTAERVVESFPTQGELAELESVLCERKAEVPLAVHLAVKLARSRRVILDLDRPLHLSVVFAVYKEHHRILTREQHENGENFLFAKLAQLRWLIADQPRASFDLCLVDDGCPEGSGRIALDLLASSPPEEEVKVLFLADAIAGGVDVTRPLTTPDDSRKGGSILFGMWAALQQQREGHVVLMTDADLSTNLGQCGLLVDPILNGGADAAIGSRREPTSVVVKKGVRNTRGKLFIYLWKQILPELAGIVDTQCGFKAFRAGPLRQTVSDMIEMQFAFDIELLIKTELRRRDSIRKVAIAWIDSEAESTTTDLQPYLPMLRKMVEMSRKYLPVRPRAEAFAEFISELDEQGWLRLLDAIPAAIAEADPADFSSEGEVGVEQLRGLARLSHQVV